MQAIQLKALEVGLYTNRPYITNGTKLLNKINGANGTNGANGSLNGTNGSNSSDEQQA